MNVHGLEALIDAAVFDFDAGQYSDALSALDSMRSLGEPYASTAALPLAILLLRVGRAADALVVLADVDDRDRLKAEVQAVLAHAFLGDSDIARVEARDLEAEIAKVPEADRSVLTHGLALAYWSLGDSGDAERMIDNCDTHVSHDRDLMRHLQVQALIAGRRQSLPSQAELLAELIEVGMECSAPEVPLLASSARQLCALVSEMALPARFGDIAMRAYQQIVWTDDLAVDHFLCARLLSHSAALRGDDVGALRLAHRAKALAPTPAWAVMALADRASQKVACGDRSATFDIEEALQLAEQIAWSEISDEEASGLLDLAVLVAPIDPARARGLLVRHGAIRAAGNRRLQRHGDRRAAGFALQANGVVERALGNQRQARAALTEALSIFDACGYVVRAAECALEMYRVSSDTAWLQMASARARPFAKSQLAKTIQSAGDVGTDPAYAAMTPKQREIFRALLDGLNANEIAQKVNGTPNTVKTHVRGVYRAFGVHSQSQLIAEAHRRKLA